MGLKLPFLQVDVFTNTPFKGNPVAVVNCMGIAEDQVSDEQLQSIANWTNLSETTFLFKPSDKKCDYKVRIFTPTGELPFAGHPTIGSGKAFLKFTETTGAKTLLQECKLGVVKLTIEDSGKISFRAPSLEIEEIEQDAISAYQKSLSVDYISAPKLLLVGPKWVVYLTSSAKACYDAEPDFGLMAETNNHYGHSGIILAGKKPGEGNDYEMRAFFPGGNVNEDPVCGSGSIALIGYLQELHGLQTTTDFKITQGGRLNRQGHIFSRLELEETGEFTFNSGGDSVIVIEGSITL